jgi:nitrite reductase (NADH) large subunit
VGNANPQDGENYRIVQSGGPARNEYRRLVLDGDILVGAVMINRIEQGGVLRSLIENRVPIRLPPEALIASGFNFGRLLP